MNNEDFSFSFDDNLTEKPNDPESFYNGILQLKKETRREKNKLKKAILLSKSGELYRIYGDNKSSEKYLMRALSLIDKSKNKTEYFAATFRLAHTYQKQKKFDLSKRLFNELEILCKENDDLKKYQDYLYQHIGKLNFDMKKYKEAMSFFKKAMKLRIVKGDNVLIDSTQLAIQVTKNKLK